MALPPPVEKSAAATSLPMLACDAAVAVPPCAVPVTAAVSLAVDLGFIAEAVPVAAAEG